MIRRCMVAAVWIVSLFSPHPIEAAADALATPMVFMVSGETAIVDLDLVLPGMSLPLVSAQFAWPEGEALETPAGSAPPAPQVPAPPARAGWMAVESGGRLTLWADLARPALATVNLVDAGGKSACIPVHISHLPLHIYIYRSPEGSRPKQVSAAGSFNGWNAGASPLGDPDGDGIFTRSERMPPGRYFYKYVVDGNWMTDPGNPNRASDGFGGENSILDIGAGTGPRPLLIPWTRESLPAGSAPPAPQVPASETPAGGLDEEQYGLTFRVVGESELDPKNILVLLNGLPASETPAPGARPTPEAEALIRPVSRARISYRHPDLTVQAPFGYQTLRIEALSASGDRLTPIFLDNRKKGRFRDDILYFAMTDRFADGDSTNNFPVQDTELTWDANYNGGDFAGISKKIEDGYFDRLGVNLLWISPPNDQPEIALKDSLPPFKKFTGYHGYWPVHPERTELRFGSLENLRHLVAAAHDRGIRVIFDLVANHVHADHPYYRDHPDWFGSVDLPDGGRNIRKWENPYTTWFDEFLPDIAYDADTPISAMTANARWWLDQTGADGFRLDAVKHVPPKFWLRLRQAMGDSPVYFVGETIDSRKTIMNFVGPGALDGQFDFPLYWPIRDVFAFGRGSFADLDAALSDGDREYDPTAIHSTLLGNHDVARFMAYADGDPEVGETVQVDRPESYRKLILAFTFLMTQSGVPMIYYGDEIGMTGGKDPDNRRMMRFDDAVAPDGRNVSVAVERLAAIRRAHPALSRGARRSIQISGETYAYLRTYFDDRLLVVLNRSADTSVIELDVRPEFEEGRLRKILTEGVSTVDTQGKLRATIPPLSAEIWVREEN